MGQQSTGCLVISGMPGAGKSTVAPLVAQHHPRAAHINGDVLSYMVVRGRVGFLGEPAEESQRQLRLCVRNMCALAANFADHDIVPVVEYPIDSRPLLDLLVNLMRPRPVRFVVLAPPPEVCEHRNATRPAEQRVSYPVAPLHRAMRERLADVGWWLDSQHLTAEETAAAIAAEPHRGTVS